MKGPSFSRDFGAGGHLYATLALHAFAARCPAPLVDWVIQHLFYDHLGPGAPFVASAVLLTAGTALAIATLRRRERSGSILEGR